MDHLNPLFLFLILTVILTTFVKSDDGAAMSEIQKSLTPPPSGWSSPDYCKWKGVTCDTSKRVTSISLSNQKLKGSLSPLSFSSLSSLQTLSLQGNSLSGPLPSLANLAFLQELYLDSNSFTEIPPKCFQGLTSLQVFSIGDNGDLKPWEIPLELADSGSLVKLYAGNCSLFGEIPDFFGKFQSLQDVRLSYNNLTGVLPRSLSGSQIQNFWINNQANGLTGSIEVLGGMEMVSQVWLHKNRFTGPIPNLSKCGNLFDLNLRDNMLTGVVPASLVELKSLRNVSIGNNELQGPVPVFRDDVKVDWGSMNKFCRLDPGPCDPQVMTLLEVAGAFGYPVKLADSWQGNDACNGWSSVVCDAPKKNVVTVNLQNQHLVGMISPAFAKLMSLRTLYLNDNNLTGVIPESLATLPSLQVLDVSNNDISGKVPKFNPVVKLNTAGNPNIGKTIPNAGGGSGGGSDGSSSGANHGSKVSTSMIVGVVIAAVIFVLVVSFIVYRFCGRHLHKKIDKASNPENGRDLVKNGPVNNNNANGGVPTELQSQSSDSEWYMSEGGKVSISIQVLRQATNDFSEENVLGRGGFGVVYRGELHDGTKVAVKRMEFVQAGSAKGMSEFQAEIAVLTKVRHRHLVALLGYCINGDERLLVYEYMPQGDLTAHLFDWREHGFSPLIWKQRVTIALDVARGVEYLHSLAQQSFIHRDLKPSNILLGDDMRAKVADFGLVKNAPDGKFSVETRLAGTFGYLAPEYAATGRVTTKVDVYAFGVILMELITGRKALDDTVPDERSHLVTWFRRIMVNKENIPKAFDQTLQPVDEDTLSSLYRVAELAGHCTAREPYQRPDMGHAVNILSPLVEQWKPASQDEEEENNGLDFNMSLPQALERWQANEGGTSTMYGSSYNHTQSSIPSKPSGMKDTVSSSDGR